MDIRSAYAEPSLTRLVRKFVYDRTGKGAFTVSDDFAFQTPQTFETALLTFGTWEGTGDRSLIVRDGDEAVRIEIEAPTGAAIEVTAEEVNEDLTARRTATRIGLRLKEPLLSGNVTLRIAPL